MTSSGIQRLSRNRLSRQRVGLASLCVAAVLLLAGCQADEERVESFLASGDEYMENDQAEEAIIEYKNVLQIDPENAAAHEALSLAYLQVEKPREAYWEMSETVRLDPDNVEARLRYGTVSAAIGDHDRSLEQADAVLVLDPTNPAAYTLRAQSREAREDFEGAEADFRAAIESDPEGPAYYYLLSGFLERRGRRDEAEEQLRNLIEIEESFLAVSTLARIVSDEDGRMDEVRPLLVKIIELAREAPVEAPERADDAGRREGVAGTTSLKPNILREQAVQSAYLLASSFYFKEGEFDLAIQTLEDGLQYSESKIELIYQMARFYGAKGDQAKEDELVRRATQESPNSVSAQLVLSAYLGNDGDLEGALEAARAARAIDPKNRAAQLRVAELLVDLGYKNESSDQIQEGRAIIDEILEAEPDNPQAHFVRAKIELAEEDGEAARASLETVIQGRPDWAQARFVLGSTLATTGDLSRARVELARAIELDPNLLDARKLLTKIHSQLGEHEFAIEQGRAYLARRPADPEIRIIVGQSLIRVGRGQEAYDEVSQIPEEERDAGAYFALGRLDIAFGRVEQGVERLKKADELSPGNPQVLRTLLALDQNNGNIKPSVERIERAAAAHPESSEIAELQAEVKLLGGDTEGARAALTRAVELDARNVTAQLALADYERKLGNTEAMIEVMEAAAAAVPESSDLQYRLALVYEQSGRRPDAINAYEKAISLNGDLAMAKNNLAYLLAESGGDLDRALELAQQAKEQLPDDGNAADTLGWVLLKRGVPSAAIGYLEEAAERFPKDAYEVQGVVQNHLAQAYEKNQDRDKAISASRASVGFYESIAKIAKERGIDYPEPSWLLESRARIERLEAAS